jgi:hypothetical protein
MFCPKCREHKPLTEFRANPHWCNVCTDKSNARSYAWRAANPGRATANNRAWQLRHPEVVRATTVKGKYKIDFYKVWEEQEGLCALCYKPMLQVGKEPTSVCVDHDRACCSGKKSCGNCVRGLIHFSCNLVLGYAKDDPYTLQKAVEYLERWRDRRDA